MRQRTHARHANRIDPVQGYERLRLSWRLLRDPRVPAWSKVALPIVAATYLFMPIDLIPDFILGFGQVDDLSVIGIAMFAMTKLLPRLSPTTVVESHLNEIRKRRTGRRRAEDRVVDASFVVLEQRRNQG